MSRISTLQRLLSIEIPVNPLTGSGAAFLFAPRQVGKTTFLKTSYPQARYIDLLNSDLASALAVRPSRLREEVLAQKPTQVVIDEIQVVPTLLGEVHWLLENTSTKFILCGSSARKLRRKGQNLLGGRAVEYQLFPFTSREIPNFDLGRYLSHGGIPSHYLGAKPKKLLESYVANYIKQEVIDEALTRNVPAFMRFLEVLGLTHAQQLNYANIARECGVSAGTVRNYFQILSETLLGFELQPWTKSKKRRMTETAKFFLFDVGVANQLHPELQVIVPGTDAFGRAFEHFLLNEVRAYMSYCDRARKLRFWRTSAGLEVDLIIGNMDVAIEIKSSTRPSESDFKGLRTLLKEEVKPKRSLMICRIEKAQTTQDGIEIIPYQHFCHELWRGAVI